MKERFLAGLKNAAVIIIASFMLLGVIPLGMISHISTVNAEGEFLRLYPETEISLTAEPKQTDEELEDMPEDAHGVGRNHYGYLRFDIRSLLEQKKDKVQGASLRLTFLKASTTKKVPVKIWLMQNDDWNRSMKWKDRPSRAGEVLVATITLSPNDTGEPQLFEIDLTEHVRSWIDEEKETVSFCLEGTGDGVQAAYAGFSHEDPLFRPCLKVVTGAATDPDEKNLQKIALSQKFQTGQAKDGVAVVQGKNEIYLKFSLKEKNIKGAIYQANLKLNCLSKDPNALLRIDRLENTTWTADSLKQTKNPGGSRYLIYREEDVAPGVYDSINLVDAINDAYAKRKTMEAFALYSVNGEIQFGFHERNQPRMELLVSDDRDAAALTETVTAVLGDNKNPEQILKNLSDDRIAENGVRAAVTWEALDRETGEPAEDVLTANGRIIRPKWFQKSRELVAKTRISAGEYAVERTFYLTVMPQETPEFQDTEFGTMIDIGDGEIERKKQVESVDAFARSRWVEGQKMTYREMGSDGVIVLHLSVDPEKQNYFTVKLWEEDAFSGIVVSNLRGRGRTAFEIRDIEMAVKEESGFYYLTYPIPMSYTKDNTYVSLRLTMIEPEVEQVSEETEQTELSTEPVETEAERIEPTVSIYAAYITQTPYFDPMTFAEQGEPVIKKEETESAFYQFVRKIYGAAEEAFDFRSARNPEEALPEEEESGVYTDVENQEENTLIFGKEEQLMLELPEHGTIAKIYRDTSYYNAYAEMKDKEYHDGKLQVVDYGVYRIFRNRDDRSRELPWKEEAMSGLYQNLSDSRYYSFLQKGQMVDNSVLAVGTPVENGSTFRIKPGETVVMMLVAEPLYYPDFRVSEIGGQPVAELKLNNPLEIFSLTFRVMGTVPKEEEKLEIICGIYERGMLVGLERQSLTVSPGQVASEIMLEGTLVLKPGQNLKVFVEDREQEWKAMTPVLELPQKQQTTEQKAS